MCMHHELSYAAEVPGLLLFGCLTAPAEGGRTAVADSQQVLQALPADLVAPFARDGWLLTRKYHDIGVSWTEAFGTEDRAEVDAYCARAGLDHEWLPDGRCAPGSTAPPWCATRAPAARLWFNQMAFLNERTMDPMVREYLVDVYGPEGLPFNTAYGDGTPVTGETVETINAAYRGATVRRAVAGRRRPAGRQPADGTQPRAVRGRPRHRGDFRRPGAPARRRDVRP